MLQMLATVVFIPIAIVEIIGYLMPRLVAPIQKIQFPVSLFLFALINLGVFYRYAPFFRKEPSVIIIAMVMAFVLAAIYCVVGIALFWKGSMENQLAGAVMLGNLNNVLVIVSSSEFFGPVEPLVAAMYMIPFFVIVIALRYYRHRRQGPYNSFDASSALITINPKNAFIDVGLFFENRQEARKLGLLPLGKSFEAGCERLEPQERKERVFKGQSDIDDFKCIIRVNRKQNVRLMFLFRRNTPTVVFSSCGPLIWAWWML